MRRSAVVAAAGEAEHTHLACGATAASRLVKGSSRQARCLPAPTARMAVLPFQTPSGLFSGGCGGPGGAECWLSPEAPFAFASAARLAAHLAFIAAAS